MPRPSSMENCVATTRIAIEEVDLDEESWLPQPSSMENCISTKRIAVEEVHFGERRSLVRTMPDTCINDGGLGRKQRVCSQSITCFKSNGFCHVKKMCPVRWFELTGDGRVVIVMQTGFPSFSFSRAWLFRWAVLNPHHFSHSAHEKSK